MKKISIAVAGALACAALAAPAGAQSSGPATTRVSDGGNDRSEGCDVARGGRAVAFGSAASNLVPDDTNEQFDVFLASEGAVERVSVTSREKQSQAMTSAPSISDDGTRVAFKSYGYHLTEAGGRAGYHFVRDTATGRTERVTVATGGGRPDTGSTGAPEISGDGRMVAFHSHATNLTPHRDRDDFADAFVRLLDRDVTKRGSRARDGGLPNGVTGTPVLSANGRYVAFFSAATNLVRDDDNREFDVFRYDRRTRRTIRVSIATDGTETTYPSFRPALSADGRYVAFETSSALVAEDTNAAYDVYVHDAFAGTTELVSRGAAGPGERASDGASISADGRYVAFTSASSNLVAGDTNASPPAIEGFDVFVRDRVEGVTTRVSVGHEGQQGDGTSDGGAISPDGNWVCWTSYASNLVPGDDNDRPDVFLRGPLWGERE